MLTNYVMGVWAPCCFFYDLRITVAIHDDVMTWYGFPFRWPFVGGIIGGFGNAGFEVFFVVSMNKLLNKVSSFRDFCDDMTLVCCYRNYTLSCCIQVFIPWGVRYFIRYMWGCLTLIPAWISHRTPSKMWNEITYPFPNFTPHFIMYLITYPCWDRSSTMLVKGEPRHISQYFSWCILHFDSMTQSMCLVVATALLISLMTSLTEACSFTSDYRMQPIGERLNDSDLVVYARAVSINNDSAASGGQEGYLLLNVDVQVSI